MSLHSIVEQARHGKGPLKHARTMRRFFRGVRLPVSRPLIGAIHSIAVAVRMVWRGFTKFFIREPYVRYRCESVGKRLVIQRAVPQIFGRGRIVLGDDVLIGNQNTWDLAYSVAGIPELIVGNRVSLNYRCMLSIATRVVIGDDTMIAGGVCIFDNISHPISPARRREHGKINSNETTPVVIGKNCWIGVNSIVLRGVTIGDNSIVAAGSIVTKSVPPNTIVAGNPAVVIKNIPDDSSEAV
jgi:acetyltransferase-like isoleucine patch superfamily enzyme